MSSIIRLFSVLSCVAMSAPALAGVPASVPVPEPVSLSLLALGAGGAIVIRSVRNRRK